MHYMRMLLCVMFLISCSSTKESGVETLTLDSSTHVPVIGEGPASEATQLPPQAPTAEATQLPPQAPTSEPRGVLPKPLYLLSNASGSGQIWRIEADGVTTQQITDEAEGIDDYSIAPRGDAIAYITGNSLIRMNMTGERIVLVEVPPHDPYDYLKGYNYIMHTPRWSPDGSEIMVSYTGLAVIPASGGELRVLIPNILQAHPDSGVVSLRFVFEPISWSPSGDHILINKGHVPEGGEVQIVDRQTLEVIKIDDKYGMICCGGIWSADGSTIILARSSYGMSAPGLWRLDTATGNLQSIIIGNPQDWWDPLRSPTLLADGTVRAFVRREEEFLVAATTSAPLFMTDIAADGSLTQLNSNPFMLDEALWFPDGSAAVVRLNKHNRIAIFPVDGGPEIDLPLVGQSFRWGR